MRTFFLCLLTSTLALADEVLVDPLNSTANWTLTGQRVCYVLGQSKIDAVPEPSRPGGRAVKLIYDFERRSWVGIQWHGPAAVSRSEKMSVWVQGDGSKHRFAARLQDGGGRVFEIALGSIDWTGWRRIDIPLDEKSRKPMLRYGEEAQPPRGPLTLAELRVMKGSGLALGSIVISDLRADIHVSPLDAVKCTIDTEAPANVFYLPSPVVLHANFSNSSSNSVQGRIELIVSDWLGKDRQFDGGALTLAAGAMFERKLQLPLNELGTYQARVRLIAGEDVRETPYRFAVSRHRESTRLDPDSPFGMGLYLPRFRTEAEFQQALKLAREAGVKWTRGDMSPTHIKPSPDRWGWEAARWTKEGSIELGRGPALTVENSAALNRPCKTGELTIAMRLKFLRLDYTERWLTLFGKGEGAQRQYHVYLNVPARQLGASFGDGAKGFADAVCSRKDWQTNRWYEVVLTHRRDDHMVQWWVDGQPCGSSKLPLATSLVANSLSMKIGGSADFALDSLLIADVAAVPDRLKTVRPVAQWNFDEGKGLRVADSSGNGNHATIAPFRADKIVAETQAAGISSYMVVHAVPPWMVACPTNIPLVPRPYTLMPNTNLWSEVMAGMAARYSQRGVHAWEIWNEPNIEPFWAPKPDATEYCQVLAAASAAIKRSDPKATVVGVSLAGPHGKSHKGPWQFLEEVLMLGGGKYMDVVSIHPYRQPLAPEDSDYVGDIRAVSDLTAKYGKRLPIWITEVGWPTDAGGSCEIWQAKMMPRSYLLAIAAGVKNVAWYDYHDDGNDPSYNEHHFGILYNDLTPKPSYFAYRTMATELAGMKFEREIALAPDASVLVFASGERRTIVAWSHRGQMPVAFKIARAGQVEIVDLMGNVEKLPARDGAVALTLTEAPVFLRDVGAKATALLPISCEPALLKLCDGESGELRLALRNPFRKPLTFPTAGKPLVVAANSEQILTLRVNADEAANWNPPMWRSADGRVSWQTPGRVVRLGGKREPIFQQAEEVRRTTAVANSKALNAADEVTIACTLRAEGATGGWQAPVTKWSGEENRNYGFYLGRENGEMHFSASFTKSPGHFSDINGGVALFDGKWHKIAVTYSKHAGEICFYVDGELAKRVGFDGGDLKPADAPLMLGSGFAGDAPKKPHAAVRDVKIWSRALTPEEIRQAAK